MKDKTRLKVKVVDARWSVNLLPSVCQECITEVDGGAEDPAGSGVWAKRANINLPRSCVPLQLFVLPSSKVNFYAVHLYRLHIMMDCKLGLKLRFGRAVCAAGSCSTWPARNTPLILDHLRPTRLSVLVCDLLTIQVNDHCAKRTVVP